MINNDERETDFEKHATLYLEDGDIVLSVDRNARESEPPNRLLFRVDKIFLSRHSKVFADMFSLPALPNGHELFEEVPIVRLVGDESEGVEDLLKLLYNPAYVFHSNRWSLVAF